MAQENREHAEMAKLELENMIFANNPELYAEIWGSGPPDVDESEVDWLVPSTEGEVAGVLDDLKALGLA